MGVLAYLSAKGAPGTTTTALLTAALWPDPVLLIDADPEGGDIALRLRRADGELVDRSRGLLSLLPLARRQMQPTTVPEHAQTLIGGIDVVAGLSGPQQAGAAGHLWSNLAEAFGRTVDRDVILDCGRVATGSVHLPLLQQADLLVCVVRPTVSSVVHTRERLAQLHPSLVAPDGHRPRVGVVVVSERPQGRNALGAAAVLERDLPGVELFGVLAHDPTGAAVFDGVETPRPERTLLVRSGHELVATLVAALRHERQGQGPQQAPAGDGSVPPPTVKGRRAAPRRRAFTRPAATERTAGVTP